MNPRAIALILCLSLTGCVHGRSHERTPMFAANKSGMSVPEHQSLDATERNLYTELDALCNTALKAAGADRGFDPTWEEFHTIVVWAILLVPIAVVVIGAAVA